MEATKSLPGFNPGPKAARRAEILSVPVAIILVALFSPAAFGLEISYLNESAFAGSSTSEQILMKGDIVPGDAQKFVDFIRKDPERFLRQTHITVRSGAGPGNRENSSNDSD